MKKSFFPVLICSLIFLFSSARLDAAKFRPPDSGGNEKATKQEKAEKKHSKSKKGEEQDASINSIIVLLMEGRPAEAKKLADQIGQKLDGMSSVQKSFLIAYAKIQVGEWGGAVKYLKECEGKYPLMADYVDYFLAESLKKSGDQTDGAAKYAEFEKNYKGSVWSGGKPIQIYSSEPRTGVSPAEIHLQRTASPDRAGDEVIEARTLVLNDHFDQGLACLEKIYHSKNLSEAVRDQALDALIEGFWRKRDYSKARVYLEAEIKKLPGGEAPIKLLQKLATANSRSNNFDEAIKIHQQIINDYPKSSYATLSRYKLAFLYMDAGRFADAIPAYEDYLAKGGPNRDDAKWAIAWCYWRLKNYSKAADAFSDVMGFGKDWRTRARFWVARSQEETGDKDAAKAIYADIAGDERFTYYGFVSLKRLGNLDKSRAKAIEASWYDNDGGGSSHSSPKRSEAQQIKDPSKVTHWDKVRELDNLGLSMLVGAEIDAAKASKEKNDIDSVELLEIEKRNGDHYRAYLQGLSLAGMMGELPRGNSMRRIAWISLYPMAYESYVKHYAKRFDVDPKLVCSIMREESTFRPAVTSPAAAVGLMQIIPPTAYRLAKELNDGSFSVDELTNPMINIKFGTWYLSQLLKMFGGEETYVIASYNAGEDAVQRWKKNSSGKVDLEEFIEEIPYSETNKYVKKVLKSYWIYKRLYM